MRLKPLPIHQKQLIRRYLIWAFKSTKESFDRLERKTTQLLADEFILSSLLKNKMRHKQPEGYQALVREYQVYINKKKETPIDPGRYAYLAHRLSAIEETIRFYLGLKELKQIKAAYEIEFIRRIWEAKDH